MPRIHHFLLLVIIFLAAPAWSAPASIDVHSYSAEIEVKLAEKLISGEVEIRFESRVESITAVDLDAPGLIIESVQENGRTLAHRGEGERLRVSLDRPARRGEVRTLRISYTGRPEKGLRFGTDQVFTSFHTSRWMVSRDDPGDKATLELRLILPAGLEVEASGRPVGRETLDGGRVRHIWKEDRPVSPFLFGFAAGRFREATAREGAVELRFLSPVFTPDELRTIFARTGEMLRFYERLAGVPFPAERYAQVLLPDAPAQEMDRLALMSEAYGRSVLDDPREDYLVAHEIAHQWWANLVTCRTWSDFWLHEGVVTYLVAAFKEAYWGRDEAEREMIIARLRFERAVSEGKNRPLVMDTWTRAEEMSGPVAYSKGALVLHLLRHEIGDRAFQDGLRAFTRSAAESGGLADSRDLQRAMEQASGRPLGWFFDQWVYGVEPEITARHREEPGAVVVEIEQRGAKPWRIGMQIAVETATERLRRTITLTRERETIRLPVSGPVLSVRVDDGGFLPRAVRHTRTWDMLLWQAVHEPDPAGRAGALAALSDLCGGEKPPAGCATLPDLLRQRADDDGARIVRQLAERALQSLSG